MNAYKIYVTPSAWVEMRALPGHMRQRAKQSVNSLSRDPRPANSKALNIPETSYEVRRARLDRWRIVYFIDEETRTLSILTVRKRPPYNYQDLAELLRSLK
ncbi:MAG TPA: type II toxin-antitoxin system RelE/ParE family toxin [Promineifilum sp.]|nr:type II toxin-antitoxin system RelE/ParE family toxin [Promineifilum sp.]